MTLNIIESTIEFGYRYEKVLFFESNPFYFFWMANLFSSN